ncbi:MAG: hypothetical protein RMM51_12365 [Verrucomicrobiae bacterium]|nr:hypothetical protein [Verrucomicrobiae bacterium]
MTLTLHWRNNVAPCHAFHVARSWRTPQNPSPLLTHDFAEVFGIEVRDGAHCTPSGIQPLRAAI